MSEPHSGNVNVTEPHSGNVNVSEPHSGNVNVSEPHSGSVNVSEPTVECCYCVCKVWVMYWVCIHKLLWWAKLAKWHKM